MTGLDLAALDHAVESALESRDESALSVLGYGEICTVLAWPGPAGPFACKRLPTFDDQERFEAYRSVFDTSIAALTERGITVHPTSLEALRRADDTVAAYCVQQVLERSALAPERLRRADPDQGHELLTRIATAIAGVVDDRVGLDAQLSNWAEVDGDLVYLDVTTPLLRDAAGADLLDTELFLSSIPAALRPAVRRFVLPSILDTYFSIRLIALDLIGNLHKEQLDGWVPVAIEVFNRRFALDLAEDEVRRYYRRDALLWEWTQRARRLDRAWQRHVRRRAYRLLLPGPVER